MKGTLSENQDEKGSGLDPSRSTGQAAFTLPDPAITLSQRMHIDLFYELSVPQFAARSEAQAVHDMLAELELADTLGFRTAWLVEHHFMREYSHASAPALLLAAAAQRTQRLRLGHAIVPLPYHHPVHVAERLGTLDILSHGRVEFGFGRGFSPREYAAFGVEMASSRARVAESLAILRRFFTGEPVRFEGQYYRLEDLDILPKVVQRPHPPLWMAAVSPASFEYAAREGLGVLVGPFKPWFMVRADIERYRAAWRAAHGTRQDPSLNPRVGMTLGIFCLEDRRRARALAKTHLLWFYRALLAQTAPLLEQLHAGYEYYRRLGTLKPLVEKTLSLAALEAAGMAVVGDPEDCRGQLERYRAAGIDHLLLAVCPGGTPSELVRESLRMLGEHVLPRFAESPPSLDAAKPSGPVGKTEDRI